MTPPAKLSVVIATSNPGKAREFTSMLGQDVTVLTAGELGLSIPDETGSSFLENATIKALGISHETMDWVIADDSGLEVDALDGAPGIHSARYAGVPSNDRANVERLLVNLAAVPPSARTARFRCCIAVAKRGELVLTAQGVCEGSIALAPRGSFGFGYDPVFLRAGGRTIAELSPAEKNTISHRAQAFAAIAEPLRTLLNAEHSAGGGPK